MTNPYYTVYFKSYYQYFLQTLTPAPSFTLKLLVLDTTVEEYQFMELHVAKCTLVKGGFSILSDKQVGKNLLV